LLFRFLCCQLVVVIFVLLVLLHDASYA